MAKQFEAVIFDLDGTLLDTLADLAAAANRMLDSNGYPTHPIDAFRHFVGDGAKMLVHRILPQAVRSKETEKRCLISFLDDYRQHWHDRTCPYPGIVDMLDALTTRHIRLAVLSNKPHDMTVHCIEHFFSQWAFDSILGQRPDVPKKPDPAGAMETARCMDLPPSTYIFVGDTSIDMKTARAAGMFAMGVRWGFRPADELQSGGAHILIDRPLDMIAHLDRRGC